MAHVCWTLIVGTITCFEDDSRKAYGKAKAWNLLGSFVRLLQAAPFSDSVLSLLFAFH